MRFWRDFECDFKRNFEFDFERNFIRDFECDFARTSNAIFFQYERFFPLYTLKRVTLKCTFTHHNKSKFYDSRTYGLGCSFNINTTTRQNKKKMV